MESLSTPSCCATSLWSSPRSSLRFRRWSRRVFNSFGLASAGGLEAVRVAWQKGNAGVPGASTPTHEGSAAASLLPWPDTKTGSAGRCWTKSTFPLKSRRWSTKNCLTRNPTKTYKPSGNATRTMVFNVTARWGRRRFGSVARWTTAPRPCCKWPPSGPSSPGLPDPSRGIQRGLAAISLTVNRKASHQAEQWYPTHERRLISHSASHCLVPLATRPMAG